MAKIGNQPSTPFSRKMVTNLRAKSMTKCCGVVEMSIASKMLQNINKTAFVIVVVVMMLMLASSSLPLAVLLTGNI